MGVTSFRTAQGGGYKAESLEDQQIHPTEWLPVSMALLEPPQLGSTHQRPRLTQGLAGDAESQAPPLTWRHWTLYAARSLCDS